MYVPTTRAPKRMKQDLRTRDLEKPTVMVGELNSPHSGTDKMRQDTHRHTHRQQRQQQKSVKIPATLLFLLLLQQIATNSMA